ncbi:MAG: hypothetical protein PVG43_08485 [Nitrosopumilaceae archaeon]|jgi:hypothetical protein
MDEKEEDKSEESYQRHLIFYQKLNDTILRIKSEMKNTSDEKLLKHLRERIEAVDLDKTRIRKLFPQIDGNVWDDLDKKN